MSIIAKSQSLIKPLKDSLTKRLPSTYVLTESLDSQGARLLISADATPAAGEQVMAIRIRGQDQQFQDVIGNAQRTYSPMVVQVIEEESTISGVSLMSLSNRIKIDWELARLGCKQERYMNANTAVPAMSQFASDGTVSSSTLNQGISDLYWPLSGQ